MVTPVYKILPPLVTMRSVAGAELTATGMESVRVVFSVEVWKTCRTPPPGTDTPFC